MWKNFKGEVRNEEIRKECRMTDVPRKTWLREN